MSGKEGNGEGSSSWMDMEDATSVIGDLENTNSISVHVGAEENVEKIASDEYSTLVQVASMPYRHCRVSIFKKSDRFFYEPVVVLDKEVTLSDHERLDGRTEATFKIKLWDYDLERRITTFLRDEVGEVGLKAHHVQVMPYEEVRLVARKNVTSFRVLSRPVCLLQLPVEVTFKILFPSEEESNATPEFLADHLELHFSSPLAKSQPGAAKKVHRDSAFCVNRRSVFPINIVSQAIGCSDDEKAIAKNNRPDDVSDNPKEDAPTDELPYGLCVPVFGATKYRRPPSGTTRKPYVTFGELTVPTVESHGSFDKNLGVFTVESAGTYLFQFEGLPSSYDSVHVQLKVNGITKAESHSCTCGPRSHSLLDSRLNGSVSLSSLMHVLSGDRIGVSLKTGELCEKYPNATRFWGLLIVADDSE